MAKKNDGKGFLQTYKEVKAKKSEFEAKSEVLEYATRQNPEALKLIKSKTTLLEVAQFIKEVRNLFLTIDDVPFLKEFGIESSDLSPVYLGFTLRAWEGDAKTRILEIQIDEALAKLTTIEKDLESHLSYDEQRQLVLEKINPSLVGVYASLEKRALSLKELYKI